jgi:hypothetical protein
MGGASAEPRDANRRGKAMSEAMPQMEEAPSSVGEVKDRVVQQAGEKTSEVKEQARAKLRDQLQERSTDMGRQLSSVGGAVNEAAQKLRDDGNTSAADLTERAGEKVSQLATYLEHADGDRMLRDLEDLGRRQPMVAVAGGLVVGFVASRFLKASSSRRYRDAGDQAESWGGPTTTTPGDVVVVPPTTTAPSPSLTPPTTPAPSPSLTPPTTTAPSTSATPPTMEGPDGLGE